jgi:hypothetical protein
MLRHDRVRLFRPPAGRYTREIHVTERFSPGQAFPACSGGRLEAACAVQDMMGVNAAYGGNVLLFSIDNVHCMTPVTLTDTLPEFATAD